MIDFKKPDGFWKTKFQIEDEVKILEQNYAIAIEALKLITKSTALDALHCAERTLELLNETDTGND